LHRRVRFHDTEYAVYVADALDAAVVTRAARR